MLLVRKRKRGLVELISEGNLPLGNRKVEIPPITSSKLSLWRVFGVGWQVVWHFATAPVGRRGEPLEGEACTARKLRSWR